MPYSITIKVNNGFNLLDELAQYKSEKDNYSEMYAEMFGLSDGISEQMLKEDSVFQIAKHCYKTTENELRYLNFSMPDYDALSDLAQKFKGLTADVAIRGDSGFGRTEFLTITNGVCIETEQNRKDSLKSLLEYEENQKTLREAI